MNMLSYDCVRAFAVFRSEGLSLSFLKENGELLSIALSGGLCLSQASLGLYDEIYDKIDKLCDLYPPFFRFFLAIALDLEDHGMPGQKGEELIHFVMKNDLYTYETSDTRRMEIINLLSRRGVSPVYETDSFELLFERVTGFMERPERFIKFNRPLFYELTHLIFFASNFGKEKINHGAKLLDSLSHIGMLAYLDNDHDLLAEVCLCYIFLSQEPPRIWVKFCQDGLRQIDIEFLDQSTSGANVTAGDDYHIYLVTSWLMAVCDKEVFMENYQKGIPRFTQNAPHQSTLSKIFKALHPVILENTDSIKTLNTQDILNDKDNVQLKLAFELCPNGHNFLEKLTSGVILV